MTTSTKDPFGTTPIGTALYLSEMAQAALLTSVNSALYVWAFVGATTVCVNPWVLFVNIHPAANPSAILARQPFASTSIPRGSFGYFIADLMKASPTGDAQSRGISRDLNRGENYKSNWPRSNPVSRSHPDSNFWVWLSARASFLAVLLIARADSVCFLEGA